MIFSRAYSLKMSTSGSPEKHLAQKSSSVYNGVRCGWDVIPNQGVNSNHILTWYVIVSTITETAIVRPIRLLVIKVGILFSAWQIPRVLYILDTSNLLSQPTTGFSVTSHPVFFTGWGASISKFDTGRLHYPAVFQQCLLIQRLFL